MLVSSWDYYVTTIKIFRGKSILPCIQISQKLQNYKKFNSFESKLQGLSSQAWDNLCAYNFEKNVVNK